jgi:hypothetical protein
MKTTKFLFILLLPMLFVQGVKGQGYVPLLDTVKQWNIVEGGDFSHHTYIYRVSDKDTVINAMKYNIIERYIFGSNTYPPVKILMREDTIAKQVYIRNNWAGPEESLLYDFSLDVGDSIHLYYQGLAGSNTVFFVASTDSITLLNGEKRKVWYLECYQPCGCWGYYEDDVWIEGIGSLYGLVFPGCSHDSYYANLLCYFETGQIAYTLLPGDTVCFASNVNIDESMITEIKVFPNPTSDCIYIETQLPEEPSLMAITDITGRVVYQSTFSSKIDVSNWPKGMYLLSVYTSTGKFVNKIIVH